MLDLQIDNIKEDDDFFLTWTPVGATLRLTGPVQGGPLKVTVRSAGSKAGLVFSHVRSDAGTNSIEIDVPGDGSTVRFFIAGEFLKPSVDYGDAEIEVVSGSPPQVQASRTAMVRIRKDATTLSTTERNRLLSALGKLNGRGHGKFKDFRDTHVAASAPEAHGNVGFLPWHRAYILDLERALQTIEKEVALPYWRFDAPAAPLFTKSYLGEPGGGANVKFDPGHPLETWVTDGSVGFARDPRFATTSHPVLLDEAATLALGTPNALYHDFSDMEGDPHGAAHVSFRGPLQSVPTAARDPLFFLLHANVDRLWAKWQWLEHRSDPKVAAAFAAALPNRVGHRLGDTMWPWNGDVTPPRPTFAPGGSFPVTTSTTAPPLAPKVEDMFDFQATLGGEPLGFAYDDVPFELPPPPLVA